MWRRIDPSSRADPRPVTDRISFKPVALLLLVPVILAAAGLTALLIAPPFAGAAFGVHELDRRLDAAGADFTKIPRFPQRSIIYANDGRTELARLYLDNREIVHLNEVSAVARKAVLAIEDSTFYEHGALNWTGLVRAMIENLKARDVVQGGSTITQQLVKNTLGLDPKDRSVERKFQEFALALRVEERYTKNRIFGMYLNQVYLGHGVYGIGTASEYYFHKPASELTLTEGALLAGMIRAPAYYDPIEKPRKATLRRNDVLNRMMSLGPEWLPEDVAEAAKRKPLGLAPGAGGKVRLKLPPYFVTYMREQIIADPHGWYGALGETPEARSRSLSAGGLEITTTLDPDWQEAAQAAANRPWAGAPLHPEHKPEPDVAIVSLDNQSGAIRTMLSGRNYHRDQKVLATTAHQPGSSFKPFILAAAFERKIPPTATYSSTSPMTFPQVLDEGLPWTVDNAEGPGGYGNIDLYRATRDSVNVVFAQLIFDVGVENVVRTSHAMGITTGLPAVPSMATGSVEVTPLDQASGYQTIANGGVHCEPYTVQAIRQNDEAIYRHEADCSRVLKPAYAKEINYMLEAVVTDGTASGAFGGWGKWPIAGKTGTANENTNVWFVGFARQVSTAVWVGSPGNPYPLTEYWGYSVFGGSIAAPIWNAYMSQVMADLPALAFPDPVRVNVPDVTGMARLEAETTLRESRLASKVQVVGSGEPAGTVVAQDPRGGTETLPGGLVTLQVSNGVAPMATVPDVVGLTSGEAAATLQAARFLVAVVERDVEDPDQDGVVLAQDPAGGTHELEGSTVTIVVGVGPAEPSPSPSGGPSPGGGNGNGGGGNNGGGNNGNG